MRSIATYVDCEQVMTEAIKRRGIRMNFSSSGAATAFRHRCYMCRGILRRLSAKNVPVGVPPFTPYDDIFIRHGKDAEGEPDTVLIFELRSMRPIAEGITDLAGNPIQLGPQPAEEVFDLPPDFKLDLPPDFDA